MKGSQGISGAIWPLFFTGIYYLLFSGVLQLLLDGLEKKLDAMVMRELYTKYKTAPTEEEKEKARKEYLDRRGVPESFRW